MSLMQALSLGPVLSWWRKMRGPSERGKSRSVDLMNTRGQQFSQDQSDECASIETMMTQGERHRTSMSDDRQ
ncbi:hypothetical protein [Amycolatopsis sp. NPDC049159]|uniref:hypothetical protein n=1 Tax=Amycolatopsis sp. NPDC049159 TaxID=3157210 RepID=UPI0033F2D805